MSDPKKFVPGLFIRERKSQYGAMLGLDFDVVALAKFCDQHKDAKGRVRITVAAKREPDKYGTHTAWLDEWKPDPNRQRAPATESAPVASQEQRSFDDAADDVPF